MKVLTSEERKAQECKENVVGGIALLVVLWILSNCLTACTVSASLDWNGKTEVNKVTHSPKDKEGHVLW